MRLPPYVSRLLPAPPVQVSFDGEIASSRLVSLMAFFRAVLLISCQFSAFWDVKIRSKSSSNFLRSRPRGERHHTPPGISTGTSYHSNRGILLTMPVFCRSSIFLICPSRAIFNYRCIHAVLIVPKVHHPRVATSTDEGWNCGAATYRLLANEVGGGAS